MSAPPPVPPRPTSTNPARQGSLPPPVPPLPPGFRAEQDSPYQFSDTLLAPRPQKPMHSVPADMSRSLEADAPYYQDSSYFPSPRPTSSIPTSYESPAPMFGGTYRSTSPLPPILPTPFTVPGFYHPSEPSSSLGSSPFGPQAWLSPQPNDATRRGPSPAAPVPPPMASPPWSPPPQPQPQAPLPPLNDTRRPSHGHSQSFSQSFATLSLENPHENRRRSSAAYDATRQVPFNQDPVPFAPIPPRPAPGEPPILTIALPTIESLKAAARSGTTQSRQDPARRVAWAKQVLNLYDRVQTQVQQLNSRTDASKTSNPELTQLTDWAIQDITSLCKDLPSTGPYPFWQAEAFFLRGTLAASGFFPAYIPRDPRAAFKDYEIAARNGYHGAWFKIGRDYEAVNDVKRAKDCFERGVRHGDKNCLYRMGMVNLLGQLDSPKDPQAAIPLLKRSADLSDVESPQSAYVYGMLLIGDFSHVELPTSFLTPYLPPTSSDSQIEPRQAEARRYLERSAHLNFAPAQYKVGWAYEFAKMGCAFDPLLSVQYYSLASQQGEEEADMALSKWFLCGAEGFFDKEETLAFTFAEKAARKGLPTAEFALGYYYEVGIGTSKDLNLAKKWYEKAAQHDNPDAPARLQAIASSTALSREQHNNITEAKLVRKRTQAKEASAAAGRKASQRQSNAPAIPSLALAASRLGDDVRANDSPYPSMPPNVRKSSGPPPSEQKRTSMYTPSQSPYGAMPQNPRRASGTSTPTTQGRQSSNTPPANRPAVAPGSPRIPQNTLSSPPQGQTSRPKYNLSDSPSSSPSVPATQRPGAVSPLPPTTTVTPAPSSASNANQPKTFAEMGFQSKPIEEKECVIM